jgi:hypothetical protein
MADKQANDTNLPGAGGNPAGQAGEDMSGAAGGELRKSDKAQVPPGSKTGTDTRPSAGGNSSVGGPGGPDTGSDAMPGQSNAL